MKIKLSAILFDMDGILIDSLDSWWDALNHALKSFHKKEISKNEFINKYWGHDLKNNLKTMHLDPQIGTFCNALYSEHLDTIKIYPDTKDTLQRLNKYVKAIITNNPKECTKQILKKFNIEKYFSFIITSDDVQKSKPSPEIIFKAGEYLNISPENVLLVGDTQSDIVAGKAAGCTVVGLNIKSDYTIKKLSELAEIVE